MPVISAPGSLNHEDDGLEANLGLVTSSKPAQAT